jgi:hypothetical protein
VKVCNNFKLISFEFQAIDAAVGRPPGRWSFIATGDGGITPHQKIKKNFGEPLSPIPGDTPQDSARARRFG